MSALRSPSLEATRLLSEMMSECAEIERLAKQIGVPCPHPEAPHPEFPPHRLTSARRRAIEVWLRQHAAECVVDCLLGRDPRLPEFYGRTMRNECVYFARSHDLVKIGISTDVPGRIENLNAMSAIPVVLDMWEPGGREIERALHTRFAGYRHHGEWFHPRGDLRIFLRCLNRVPQRKWRQWDE